MKVLITHPDFEDRGGVSNLYKKLKNKFNVPILHFIVGKRPEEKYFFSKFWRLIYDYYKFIKCIKANNIDLVHINPSLDPKSFIRDGVFACLAKLMKRKTVVFFHGWQKSFERFIKRYFIWLFKFFYGKSDAFIVLADEFKIMLRKWGITQSIYREINVISEDEIVGLDIQETIKRRQNSKKWYVLFLSRITKDKGIYETIKTISLLKNKYPMIELIIAGDGEELNNVKSFVSNNRILNVKFVGYVRGEEKRSVFENTHLFCFPTYHGEGLPVAVIEAIAFGLPVVTRPVGGLPDFFKNEKHGLITKSLNPVIYAKLIEKLFLDKELYEKISLFNYQYAQSHFLASNAILRLEKVYSKVMQK